MEKENTNSLQVGAGPVKVKNVNKPLFGHYKKVKVEPKRYLTEFKVTEDAFLPVGKFHFVIFVWRDSGFYYRRLVVQKYISAKKCDCVRNTAKLLVFLHME